MTKEEDWRERRHRHDVKIKAEVHYPDGLQREVLLTNLSLDGCRITGWFRIGDVLDLTIPSVGRLAGQVRWAFAGEAGIRFMSRTDQVTRD